MRKKDYIQEFVEYQEKQYLPETYYPEGGGLARHLQEGDKKPRRMAILMAINVIGCIAVTAFFVKEFVKSDCQNWSTLAMAAIFAALTVILALAVVNYIRKLKKMQADALARKAAEKKHKRKNKNSRKK